METARVPLMPETLRWFMERAAIGAEDLARTVRVKPAKVLAWLEGDEKPTYNQAKQLADRLHIAFSQLLLPPPREPELPLRDFRRGRARRARPSPELTEAIYDALRKRDWWRQNVTKQRLPFVESQSWRQCTPEAVANEISKFIPIRQLQEQARSWAEFLKQIAEAVEEAGILVLRQSYAGSNTRRVYNPEEFAGFAIADPMAPVVFVNARDPLARQIFTLAHELVHVWIGESVLDAGLESPEEPEEQVEQLCDKAAAALLMPEGTFRNAWGGTPYEAAQEAARRFKVSVWATLRRAWELRLISREDYRTALERAQESAEQGEQREGAGNFWSLLQVRNSKRFTWTVAKLGYEGEISVKEVASLLNIGLATALDFIDKFGNVPR